MIIALLVVAAAGGEIDVFDIFTEQESVIVSAARREQQQSDAPSATTIISSEQIRRSGVLLFADLIRRYAGVDVTQVSPNEFSVGIRGDLHTYKNDKVLVLIDGRPFHVEGFGSVNWQTILNYLEDIDRVEIVRGPGSTLYGANAFSGTINIVLKRPSALPKLEASLSGGMYSADVDTVPILHRPGASYRGHLGHALTVGPVDYRLFIDYMAVTTSEGFGQGINNGNFGGELNYHIDADRQLRVSSLFSGGGRQDNYSVAETTKLFDVANSDTYSSVEYQDKRFAGRATDGFSARVAYRHTGDFFLGGEQLNRGSVQSIQTELGYTSSALDKQTLSIGGDFRYNIFHWSELDPGLRGGIYTSLYVLDDVRIADVVTLSLGVRGELSKFARLDPFLLVSPRAAVVWRAHKEHALRLGVARGMRAPSALDLFAIGNPPRLLVGNPGLRPEDAWNIDLGWTFNTEHLRGSVSPFLTMYDNMRQTDRFTQQNLLSLLAVGGEAELTWSVNTFFRVGGNYSFQEWWRRDTWQPFAAGPRHKLNVIFDIDLPFGIEANLAVGWIDTTVSFDRTPQSNPFIGRAVVGSRTFIDAKVAYPTPWGIELFVTGTNLNRLFASVYESPAGLAAPIGGRILAGATYRLR